jgi:hypothetical protein
MAKPKMALIPSTVGGSVYSVLPSNGDGDFNFSRASAATRINAQGLIETVAATDNRLNYPLLDGTVQTCPHLLLEPQRTNLITYSESFSQWTNSNSSDLSNQLISPDGTLNADKLITNSGLANGQVTKNISKSASAITYTYSVFAKKGEWNRCNLYVSDTASFSNRVQFFVDLENGEVIQATTAGTFSSASGSSEYYGNGWYRFFITFTTSTESTITARIYSIDSTATTGDGTSGIYIYGAQLEEGSYPTSYIVSNSGSATTRLAEECNGSGNASTFNGSEGVLFVQMSALANNATTRRINLRNSSGSNQIRIEYGSSSNLISGVLFNGSNQAVINNTSYNVIDLNKIAFKYKENDFALWINGFEVGVDTSGTTIGAGILDRIDLSLATTETYSNVKQIQYFDSALNDTDLETLTSWMSFSDMAIDQEYSIQ